MSAGVQTKVQAGPAQSFTPAWTGLLQRACNLCNTPGLVGERSERDEEGLILQRSPVDRAEPSAVPPIVHEVLRSPGQPLDTATRSFMEPRFGHDFSRVRVQMDVSKKIQTRLIFGQPNDQYEREADRVAAEVVSRINAPHYKSVQHQGLFEESEEQIQMKPLAQQIHSFSEQNFTVGREMGVTPNLEMSIRRARGDGNFLPERVREPIEEVFGTDFSKVRIHTDAVSHRQNQALKARAFTIGQDIFFRRGEYNPWNTQGRELIAHELMHVVQQQSSVVHDMIQCNGGCDIGDESRRPSPAPNAFHGIEAYFMVQELPFSEYGDPNYIIQCGPYILGPNLRRTTPPTVVYYLAYRTNSRRNEFVVGPDSVERFSQNLDYFIFIANAGLAWVPPGQQPAAYQAESARSVRSMLEGEVGEAISAYGRSMREAVTDPGWLLSMALAAMPIRVPVRGTRPPTPPQLRGIQGGGGTPPATVAPTSGGTALYPTSGTSALVSETVPVATAATPSPALQLVPTQAVSASVPTQAVSASLPAAILVTATAPVTMSTPAPAPTPAPDVDFPGEPYENDAGCLFEPIAQQYGRYPCHGDFASELSGTRREVRVTTPEGTERDFDAIDWSGTLYEVKTGYRWLPFLNPDDTRRQDIINRFINQSTIQFYIANRCNCPLIWYFNEEVVADLFTEHVPLPPPIHFREFECNQDSDD